MRTDKFDEGQWAKYLDKIDDDPLKPHWLIYRAKRKLTYTKESDRSWNNNNYQSICEEIENLNLFRSILISSLTF